MDNKELTKIREEKKLSKSDFAKLLNITPMLLGKYEKGSINIPDSIVEKLKALADAATATESEVKKTARKAARKAIDIPNIIIQSPMGGHISLEEIAGKVPKNTADVYVRVDENKLYYMQEDGQTGDVDIW